MKNQGKRQDQIKYSEDVSFYGLLGLIAILLFVIIKNNI